MNIDMEMLSPISSSSPITITSSSSSSPYTKFSIRFLQSLLSFDNPVTLFLVKLVLLVLLLVLVSYKTAFGTTPTTKPLISNLNSNATSTSLAFNASVRGTKRSSGGLKSDTLTQTYRWLYHQLQNAEIYPDSVFSAWEQLRKLLDMAVWKSLKCPDKGIMSINSYDFESLKAFLAHNDSITWGSWKDYLERRANGGPREILKDRIYAEHWLRLAAPVKFVDGIWLGRIHHNDTPHKLRHITRIAWQILSEELGDGDLDKNHVFIYSELLKSIGVDVGTGDSPRFVDEETNPGQDPTVWAAAIAQLALGMFPRDLLPEILGFNLAYEAVTLDTLICVHELKELNLDPTYFSLHVTIDNSDSGHTAMALQAVVELMKMSNNGDEENTLWRRVQAGYALAQQLPVTPKPPTPTESELLKIFTKKCGPARAAHQACKARIGGKKGMTISEWMDPGSWEKRKFAFLDVLSTSVWVSPGAPEKSRLVKEVVWKGRMFGAFTTNEVSILESWIQQTDPWKHQRDIFESKGAYVKFIGHDVTLNRSEKTSCHSIIGFRPDNGLPTIPLDFPVHHFVKGANLCALMSNLAIPLQHYLSSSAKSATIQGMNVLRILRILNGLLDVGNVVAGMDAVIKPAHSAAMDIALSLQNSAGIDSAIEEWSWLQSASLAPSANFWFLVGVQSALAMLISCPEAFGVEDNHLSRCIRKMSSKVMLELECLQFREHAESRYGFWMTINFVIGKLLH